MISTASKNDLNLVAVTLNDGDDWKDHQPCLTGHLIILHRLKSLKKVK
ncbi:D-alanyl-D-alanine carboxypeptidase [Sporolactobacillus inulinus]|uniref:D-alanyl-D-alanine carboxypeptidase n=1 Tax=Sporolactobacillus inulinus TaxID=2078 RepID=A0A4Y1ZGW5_9BACL|nr:D-alanyl-D-alanine carboxypeptidase [Sporolactobacillus inulinus]